MSSSLTVVISCAGMGRRLGLSKTKALAQVCGRPLIHWQLDALSDVENVRVVVGYQAEEVIDCVRQVRNDVIFAFNRDYQTTGTAASLVAGAQGARGMIVSLDGDLLVSAREMDRFIMGTEASLGVLAPISQEPLYAFLHEDMDSVVGFSKSASEHSRCVEWSGLCKLYDYQIEESVKAGRGRGHVYELVEPHLPLRANEVNVREIDTPDDFEMAERWLQQHIDEWSGNASGRRM